MGKKPSIYFYCYPQGPADKAGYQHYSIALAEGLSELGIPFYANINYWPQSPDNNNFLFNACPDVSPYDCDIVILSHWWFEYGYKMPKDIFNKKRRYITVYLDHADGVYTYGWKNEFRKFDFILKSHFNNKICSYPSNMHPVSFGLTNRIINATKENYPWQNREKKLLSNFRVQHPIRKMAIAQFYPFISSYFDIDYTHDSFSIPQDRYSRFEWEKTGRRHNPEYYAKMLKSQAVSCFGGFFYSRQVKWGKLAKILNKITPENNKILMQWDSWRLWEAFSAGCLVFFVDFECFGLTLPVMPKNWEHYIGVNFDDLWEFNERLQGNLSRFGQIAENGKKWALENYRPKNIAQRFLELVGKDNDL